MRALRFAFAVLFVATLMGAPATVQAAFPGGNGKLVFAPGDAAGWAPLTISDEYGSTWSAIPNTDGFIAPAWSASGRWIAALDLGTSGLFVFRPDGSGMRQLISDVDVDPTTDQTQHVSPTWAPAGDRIAFTSYRDGNREIYSVTTGTSPALTRLTNNPARDYEPAWSPDGKKIAFISDRAGNDELYVMNADGSSVTRLTFTPYQSERQPSWAPDGSRIAFARSLQNKLFAFDTATHTISLLLTISNGAYWGAPAWSPDGMFLAVGAGDDSALYDVGGTFVRELSSGDVDADWQPLRCTISGTDAADTLVGTSGADVICGKNGNDTINGRAGNDTILGGGGNDALTGGYGNDALVGGLGSDTMTGGSGTDRCDGGLSTDLATSCERAYRIP